MKRTFPAVLAACALSAATPARAQLVIPYTFTPGTPAKAVEVNANFAAVKSAVDAKAGIASPTFTGVVTAPTFSGNLSGNATTATTAVTATTANAIAANAVTPSDLNAGVGPVSGQVPSKAAGDTFTWVTPITGVAAIGGLTATTSGGSVTLGTSYPVHPIITALGAPRCTGMTTVGSSPSLHTTLGTFTKQYANTPARITFHGNVLVQAFTMGLAVAFELRVDGASANGGGAQYYFSEYAGTHVPASIEAYFSGLGAGPHSVELWAYAPGGSATNAYQDPGCFSSGKVLVQEN